ncbi:hypothetical protein D3C78_1064540 [compost metagenome]
MGSSFPHSGGPRTCPCYAGNDLARCMCDCRHDRACFAVGLDYDQYPHWAMEMAGRCAADSVYDAALYRIDGLDSFYAEKWLFGATDPRHVPDYSVFLHLWRDDNDYEPAFVPILVSAAARSS